jgi:hypothetical protein
LYVLRKCPAVCVLGVKNVLGLLRIILMKKLIDPQELSVY